MKRNLDRHFFVKVVISLFVCLFIVTGAQFSYERQVLTDESSFRKEYPSSQAAITPVIENYQLFILAEDSRIPKVLDVISSPDRVDITANFNIKEFSMQVNSTQKSLNQNVSINGEVFDCSFVKLRPGYLSCDRAFSFEVNLLVRFAYTFGILLILNQIYEAVRKN